MDIQALLALQEEDGRLRDLQRELKVLLPGRRDEAEKRLDEAKQRVKAAEAEHLQAVKEFEHFNRQYQRDRDRMARAERNAVGQTGARALAAADQEHRDAAASAAAAEAGMAEAGKARTPTERKLDEARQVEAEEELAVKEIREAVAARKAAVEAELEKVKAKRESLVGAVPPAQLRYYERLKLTRWPCAVEYNRAEGVCTGCNLVQPPSVTQAVLHADKTPNAPLVTCPACGRILI